MVRFEHQRTEGRRQREGIYPGYHNGDSQRERELPVEHAHRACHHGYRHEYRRHHQRNRHDSPADLTHCFQSSFPGSQALFVHLGMHGLHHHDGVIHHNTDGQHQRKQCEQVDGEAEHVHKEEGAYQRYRHGQNRDEGRTEVLQEDENDNGYQDEGLDKRYQYLLHGGVQEARHVIGNVVLHARREGRLLQLGHFQLHVLNHLFGVGARALLDHDRGRRAAVGFGHHAVIQGPELDVGHVFEAQDRAGTILLSAYGDVFVLGWFKQLAGIAQHVLQHLRVSTGAFAGFTGSGFHVLGTDSGNHLIRRHAIGHQAVRFQPYPHGVFTVTHDLAKAHAVDALELLQHVDVGEVVDELLVCVRVVAHQVEVEQHAVHLFLGGHTGLDYLFRQLVKHGSDAVLHVYSRQVGVGTYLKEHLYQCYAVVTRHRRHVGHPRHTVDSALQGRSHGIGTHFGIGSGILGRYRNGGRHNVGELGDGQIED